MKFTRKFSLITIGLIIFGLFISCVSEPEDVTESAATEDKVEKVSSDKGEPQFKTETLDTYVVSRESLFLDDGSANGYKEYSYDAQGNLTGITNYRASGDLLFEETYFFDEMGRKIKSELYDNEGLTSYTLFTYSDFDSPSEEKYYNHKDVYLSGSRYQYDSRGRKTLWESLDDNKSLVLKSEYVYKDDLLMKVSFFTPLNKEDGSLDYVYDGDRLIKEVSINGSGKEERRTEYEYDGDKLVKTKLFQLGRLSRVNEMTLDGDNNVSLMTTYNRTGKILNTTQFEYLAFQVERQVPVK